MKINKSITVIVCLFMVLAVISSCKRTAIDEPAPFGPSTFATLLEVAADPNVVLAGLDSRETTIITATLKTFSGDPIANKIVHFDIRDALGNRTDLGFFEGNESVKTGVTGQNGKVSVSYFGPFSHEMATDAVIYVSAEVAWAGKEFITELAPIYLIRDSFDMTFTAIAVPNVLLATKDRPQSLLKAYFKTVDGIPLTGRKVYFSITEGSGYFENGKRLTYVLTDANGYAELTYLGPTKYEMGYMPEIIEIKAQPETMGTFERLHEEIKIRVTRED